MMKRRVSLSLLACIALSQPLWSQAQQSWPNGSPIKLVTPTPVGVGIDTYARLYASMLGRELNTAVYVDNRPGASSTLGIDAVAKAAPNGLTLLMANNLPFMTNPVLMQKLPYDAKKDLIPVAQLFRSGHYILASPSFPGNSLKDLVAAAKQRPDTIAYASYGPASTGHLGMELLQDAAGIQLLHIPYKQSPMPDLMSGQVSVSLEPPGSAVPNIKAGRVKALAYTDTRRSSVLPDVPTVAETLPGFEMIPTWVGLWVPASTPEAIVKRLQSVFALLNKDPGMLKVLADSGSEAMHTTQAEMIAAMERESQMTGRLIKTKNITLN